VVVGQKQGQDCVKMRVTMSSMTATVLEKEVKALLAQEIVYVLTHFSIIT